MDFKHYQVSFISKQSTKKNFPFALYPISICLQAWGKKITLSITELPLFHRSISQLLFFLKLPWWLRGWSACLQCVKPWFDPWIGKIPWRRKRQPTPVLLLRNPMEGGAWCRLLSMGSRRVGHDWATSLLAIKQQHFLIRSLWYSSSK